MRAMKLPQLVIPDSLDFAVGLYTSRLRSALRVSVQASAFLTAYLAWPNDEQKRNSWVATILARSLKEKKSESGSIFESLGGLKAVAEPAFDSLAGELRVIQSKWTPVADVFLRIVDMADDDRIRLRGGASISKAIALCEYEKEGRSHAQLYRLWKQFHEVAHLIAAGAIIAGGVTQGGSDRSIFSAVWYSPDAVLGIAAGFEQFGLSLALHGRTASVLPANTTWRLPAHCCPSVSFLVKRRLSDSQIDFLNARRATKAHISKP
jgi:hypothetical protein